MLLIHDTEVIFSNSIAIIIITTNILVLSILILRSLVLWIITTLNLLIINHLALKQTWLTIWRLFVIWKLIYLVIHCVRFFSALGIIKIWIIMTVVWIIVFAIEMFVLRLVHIFINAAYFLFSFIIKYINGSSKFYIIIVCAVLIKDNINY